mmetsp:Transcript_7567/g.8590  ORF Transcript_7567/g.8590 Transcript_7567/m.8590 type:complete len:251 (-) Transcript_7567:240-992(-)
MMKMMMMKSYRCNPVCSKYSELIQPLHPTQISKTNSLLVLLRKEKKKVVPLLTTNSILRVLRPMKHPILQFLILLYSPPILPIQIQTSKHPAYKILLVIIIMIILITKLSRLTMKAQLYLYSRLLRVFFPILPYTPPTQHPFPTLLKIPLLYTPLTTFTPPTPLMTTNPILHVIRPTKHPILLRVLVPILPYVPPTQHPFPKSSKIPLLYTPPTTSTPPTTPTLPIQIKSLKHPFCHQQEPHWKQEFQKW